ncbi:GTP-binding protein [Paramyrothecium foliicola]|nr:GTP-binding protein [Paramyrothecium foliicola]
MARNGNLLLILSPFQEHPETFGLSNVSALIAALSPTKQSAAGMASRCSASSSLLAPFLYPSFLFSAPRRLSYSIHNGCVARQARASSSSPSTFDPSKPAPSSTLNDLPESRLNPRPDDYAAPYFADKTQLSLYAGRGGNGCVSFLREAFLPEGPPNGGDGGAGGNVYIQAAHGETSLHKLARRRFIRAGNGKHGQGSARSGTRGEDVVITVPVGTVIRELEREDPAAEEAMSFRAWRALQKQRKRERREQDELEARAKRALQEDLDKQRNELEEDEFDEIEEEEEGEEEYEQSRRSRRIDPDEEEDLELDDPQRGKWLLYPGMTKNEMRSSSFPKLPRRTRHFQQPPAPIYLDLSRPTPRPILLAAGGVGGLGNPHFTSKTHPRPVFATRGDEAVSLKIELELKLLADVGLVGLPNAGKSTLLRALSNSRARVGNWAFTTLQPNIGTVVLDKYSGRPDVRSARRRSDDSSSTEDAEALARTRFTIADIPGLIEGAHLDRGLGIAFLRHVERAGVLAFVIDLSAGNAVTALQSLWTEVGLYAQMRDEEELDREAGARVDWDLASEVRGPLDQDWGGFSSGTPHAVDQGAAHPQSDSVKPTNQIAAKPWFVVATKADLPETQANFQELKAYLDRITRGEAAHPSGVDGAWVKNCTAIPVSAIHGQGTDRIIHWTVGLLDE